MKYINEWPDKFTHQNIFFNLFMKFYKITVEDDDFLFIFFNIKIER